jgi:polar amino acid transport system permease protein
MLLKRVLFVVFCYACLWFHPFGWFSWFHEDMVAQYGHLFVSGTINTLKSTFLAILLGCPIGILMGVARVAEIKSGLWKPIFHFFVKLPADAYVTFFRGTPLVVQIMLVHFGLMPLLISEQDGFLVSGELARTLRQEHGALTSGLIALTLNAGAYITEIVRAGILSLDKGQTEAARSLGMSYSDTMKKIILPQAFRRMLPPLGNEMITLLKDSSLIATIGFGELFLAAKTVAGAYSRFWEPYLTISVIYLIFTIVIAHFVTRLENHYRVTASHA